MTDEELAAVREYAGDLLIRAFRGEVDLATALAEVRDLSPGDLSEVAELPDDLDDDETLDETEVEPEAELKVEPELVVELDEALAAVARL